MLKAIKRIYEGVRAIGVGMSDGKWYKDADVVTYLRSGKRIYGLGYNGFQLTGADGMALSDLPKEQRNKPVQKTAAKYTQVHNTVEEQTLTSHSRSILRLYHGNPKADFKAFFGGGMEYHDYGKGLYCVESLELAKEWACQYADKDTSYVFVYDLDLTDLRPIFDLNALPPVYWISALAQHRFEKDETRRRKEQRERFIKVFPIDCEKYGIIKGWRADDSYFAYLRNFLRGDYSYEAVIQAMELGDLGQQIVIKGEQAYANRNDVGRITISGTEYEKYYGRYQDRDNKARTGLKAVEDLPGLYIEDVIREGERGRWKTKM